MLLYSRNQHHIVKQLSSNYKINEKKKKADGIQKGREIQQYLRKMDKERDMEADRHKRHRGLPWWSSG